SSVTNKSSTMKSPSEKLTKEKKPTSTNKADSNTAKTKDKNKKPLKDSNNRDTTKTKRSPQIRTPFDKVLDKLTRCASSSPSLVEVMEENLKELQTDAKYTALFQAAPHTAAFIKKKNKDSSKFITGLRQALGFDWSNPAWKSADEIDTLFRPFKQQFVYAMMRFNCTS
ncbi:unnamed protein product, partial [Adineta steineri]